MNAQVLVRRAAVLNTEGIGALACGQGEKAHACFKNVLELMGHVTQSADLQESSCSEHELLQIFAPVSVPNMQDERFYVYSNALMFTLEETRLFSSQMDITLYSAAAIFNMALTYHQRAMLARSTNVFRIAARMYDQCLQILRSLATPCGDVNTLRMIILNNRSHIYFELDEFEKAAETLGDIRKLSRHLSRSGNTSTVLQERTFDEITLNVLTTAPPSTAPCA